MAARHLPLFALVAVLWGISYLLISGRLERRSGSRPSLALRLARAHADLRAAR